MPIAISAGMMAAHHAHLQFSPLGAAIAWGSLAAVCVWMFVVAFK